MPLSLNARNRLAGWLGGATVGLPITHLSLHSAIPDSTGSNEITGGTPAYARKAVTWAAVADSVLGMQGSVTFDVPATAVAYVGLWTAVSGGTFMGYVPTNGGSLFGWAVGRSGDSILSPAHGLAEGDNVTLAVPSIGGSLPTGYSASAIYRVSVVDADQFDVVDTDTLLTVTPSSSAPVLWQRLVVDTYASQGTMTVSALQVSVGA
jgi:hypothetical protein